MYLKYIDKSEVSVTGSVTGVGRRNDRQCYRCFRGFGNTDGNTENEKAPDFSGASSQIWSMGAGGTAPKRLPLTISLTRPWLIPKRAAMSCCIRPSDQSVLIRAAIGGVTGGDRRLYRSTSIRGDMKPTFLEGGVSLLSE